MNTKCRRALAAAALGILLAPALLAEDVVVVANPGLPFSEISAADLKQVFIGAKTSVDGASVEPVLADQGPAHAAFLRLYVDKSDAALRNQLKSLVFTGKGSMPKSFSSDAAIVQYVAKTKGAIGYVAASANTESLKKLAVK